ncbi:NTP transferase domain-containing protein [Parasphingorhabdus flavimaris]|uniref:NTP transferase domain-containing protein n=1 Tax=Parasphingorhabdus flavimaris TaxID=266812 RepID=UPI0030024791
MSTRFDVILLAAQRVGVTNPLAEAHGVSHKCLIPIADQILISRTLASVSSHPGCRAIHILIEPDGELAVRPVAEAFAKADLPIYFIASDSNIAGSVLLGCENGTGPFVITTADNVLIKHESIDRVVETMAAGADAVAALANKDDVRSIHPAAQRFFYEFRDHGYANCNLYGIASERALHAVEIFREGGQFMNHPRRLVNAFGLFNILLMRFGWVTVDNAFQRMSKRFGITMRRAPISDGTQAIDVDNDRTYRIVEAVLQNRIDDLKI